MSAFFSRGGNLDLGELQVEAQGLAAAGAPPSGNPLSVAGTDSTDTVRAVRLDSGGRSQVFARPSDALIDGSTAVTTSAAALAASLAIAQVIVQNANASASTVLVGSATSQHFELTPGQALTIQVDDLAKVYVVVAGGTATVHYLARSVPT